MSEFDTLIQQCASFGEPFQCLTAKSDGSFQVSLRSRYSKGAGNAFACDSGSTPTEALKNIMKQRKIDEEDPLA